jgi:hypothetical protein
MSAYRDAIKIDAYATGERLAAAAAVLASGTGVVMLDKRVAMRPAHAHIRCEVVDPMPSARRCEQEYEVLVENARRTLESSAFRSLMPRLPLKWLVVEDQGTGIDELWPCTTR